jgi:hypothetical protein
VAFAGLRADGEDPGDLLGRVSFRDQLDHLVLSGGEDLSRDSLTAPDTFEVVADERAHHAWVEEGLASTSGSAGVHEVPVRDGLEHVAAGACLQGREEVLLVVVHRQHQHPRWFPPPRQFACGLQPGPPGHRDVEHRQVDGRRTERFDRLGAVTGFGDHLQIRFAVQDQSYAASHQSMIGGQQGGSTPPPKIRL